MESQDLSLQSDYFMRLPIEIVADILSRLPADTIGSCRTLRKQFYNLTTGPHFIQLHLMRSQSQSPRILLSSSPGGSYRYHYYWACFDEGSFKKIPHRGRFDPHLLAEASCNGLLCMSRSFDYDTDPVVIYNPLTRESAELPNSMSMNDKTSRKYVHVAFGYDLVHDKYKVVRLFTKYDFTRYNFTVGEFTAEIITLGESSWRRLDLPSGLRCLGRHLFHNGMFYWVSAFPEECRRILIFDIRNEMFHTIELSTSPESPFWDPDACLGDFTITKLGELVGLVEMGPDRAGAFRTWKITGNKTAGYQLCFQTLEVPDVRRRPGPQLHLLGILGDGSYLLAGGQEDCEVDGRFKKYRVVALLSHSKNEEGSVEVQYAAGELQDWELRDWELHYFRTLLIVPSLVSPSTLLGLKINKFD